MILQSSQQIRQGHLYTFIAMFAAQKEVKQAS